jgi:hypothetical protein
MAITSTWRTVPREYRATLRSYINSEQPADRERALAECATYGIDYAFARMAILAEMAEEGRVLLARQTAGESKAERFKAEENGV